MKKETAELLIGIKLAKRHGDKCWIRQGSVTAAQVDGVPLEVLDRKQVTTGDQTQIECAVSCQSLETKFGEAEALLARLADEEQKALEPVVTPVPSPVASEMNPADATDPSDTDHD